MAAIVVLGALAVVAAWGMAALANARSSGAPAARRVALLLFVMGADMATSVVGLYQIVPERHLAGVMTVHFMLDAAVPPLTLLFMARALETPVARALRHRAVEAGLVALAVAGPIAAWVGVHRVPSLGVIPYLFTYIALGFLAGFVLALHGWRKAEGRERRRAGMFAVAFGVLDVAWAVAFGSVALEASNIDIVALQVVYGGGALVFALVLGYGILQHQLLGIDVKVRFAISKSTVAAVFIAVFFVASEAAQQFFGESFGGTYVGIAAAGALVFAIAPLQRAAERLAEKAVPVAQAAPAGDIASSRSDKEESYKRALRLALRDRILTREEEVHLHEVAEHMGIGAGRAMALRVEVERETGDDAAAKEVR